MFGFGLGMFAEVPESTPIVVSYVYYALATTCLGAEMYCLTNATLCTVLGPTLALNGPRGSMHAAVQGMYQEVRALSTLPLIESSPLSSPLAPFLPPLPLLAPNPNP